MVSQILETKLYIPQTRSKLASRRHLIDRLNNNSDNKLILITAPAGYGKSTLVSGWANQHQEAVAWLSLEELDNEANRFVSYLIAAIQSVEPEIGAEALLMLGSSQTVPMETILTTLISDFAFVVESKADSGLASAEFKLVLDDYHFITSQIIHDAIEFLLRHLPPVFQMIIVSRMDPPLRISRLRARRELMELREADLRFTLEETQHILNHIEQLNLTETQVEAINRRTEGWITGLHLAVLTMRNHKQRDANLNQFIEHFTGDNRFIADYLIDEVIDSQPDNIQEFLLLTSVLDRMTGGLCDAVTDQQNSQTILEQLERKNLFLIAMDDRRQWYRYHHLFTDLLRHRIQLTHPERIPDLHQRAARWYLHSEQLDEAILHFTQGHDFDSASELVIRHGQDQLNLGDYSRLGRWLALMPEDVKRSDYRIACLQAWIFYFASDVDAVASWLDAAQQAFDQYTFDSQQEADIEHAIYFNLTVWVAYQQGDLDKAVQIVDRVNNSVPETHTVSALYPAFLGEAQRRFGHFDEAIENYETAIKAIRQHEVGLLFVGIVYALATIHLARGQLTVAQVMLQDAIEYSVSIDQDRHTATVRMLLLAIAYERNQIDRIQQQLPDIYQRIKYQGARLTMSYYLLEARMAVIHAPEQALEALKQSQCEMQLWTVLVERPAAEAHVMRLRTRIGDHERVNQWLASMDINAPIVWAQMPIYIAMADALRFQDTNSSRQQAHELVQTLYEICNALGAEGTRIDVLCLEALLLMAEGNISQALIVIERALQLGQPEGFIRTFVDYGEGMSVLLREAQSADIYPDYCQRLLDASGKFNMVDPSIEDAQKQLADPLTERELGILRLMSQDYAYQEIADELVVSLNTVRYHAKNIYSKLGVNKKSHAITEAKKLNLI